MPNKIIILLVLISNLFFLIAFSNDHISFVVSEIEFLDNGNNLIGKNRGTITTNNGILLKLIHLNLIKLKIF